MAHDDDDIIDRSPMIVRHHRKYPHRHNIRRNNNGRYWDNDYEANYNEFGVTQQTDVTALHEEYKHDNNTSSNTIIDNDDLPTPLLDHRGYRDRQQHDLNTDDYLVCSPSRIQTPQEEQTMEQQLHRHRLHQEKPKLNGLNYLNVITYILNVFTSYFIGVCGLFGVLPTRRDIFIEYETLVTPADYAYYIWAPILVFEFFFATAQLFPHYRARPIIQQGTGLYFFWACILQTIWTIFFALKWFILSFVAVCLVLLCLAFLLASQHYNCVCPPTTRGGGGMAGTLGMGFRSPAVSVMGGGTTAVFPMQRRRNSVSEYWFFRFPFYLHCGWLMVCTVVQFSMVFRYRFTASSGAQLMSDIVALGVLLPPSTFFLTGQSSGPDFVIPSVIIWSYISIGIELHRPSDTLVDLYGHPAILAVQNASYVFTGIIFVMLIPRIVIWIFQEFCTIDVVELVDEEEDNISTTMNEVRIASSGLFNRFSLSHSRRGEPSISLDPSLDDEGDNCHDDGNDTDNEGENCHSENIDIVEEKTNDEN